MGFFRRTFARRGKEPTLDERDEDEEEHDEIQHEKQPSSDREDPQQSSEVPWTLLSTEWRPDELLLPEVEELYWDGVRRELEIVLLTLKQWQEQEGGAIPIPDECDVDFVHGFDTFVDQVCEESRNFARRYAREKALRTNTGNPGYYRNQMSERLLNLTADRLSSTIKEDIRATLEQGSRRLSPIERCAEMLLQSTSFLDIEKIIEHDPAADKRPQEKSAIPQMTMKNLDGTLKPFIAPLECSSCRSPIRSSVFWKKSFDPLSPSERPSTASGSQTPIHKVCEDCYRKYHYGDRSYYKREKECILPLIITPELGRRMCQCKSIHPLDSDSKPRKLFPMPKEDKSLHDYSTNPGGPQCRLIKLSSFLAQAKYETTGAAITQRKIAKRPTSLLEYEKHVENTINKPSADNSKTRKKFGSPITGGSSVWKASTPTSPTLASSAGSRRMSVATTSTTDSIDEAEVDDDIPLFSKSYARKNPFAHVRMALRVGPLLIGNQMVKGRSGAVVTLRDPPFLQKQQKSQGRREVLVNGDPDRAVSARELPGAQPRPYRAVMKQVIGTAFTGLTDPDLELEIIRDLAAASQTLLTGLGGLTQAKRQQIMDDLVQQLVLKVKDLIGSRAQVYLENISDRLLEPEMNLSWSSTKNNCQDFCDALIDQNLFAPFIAPAPATFNDRGIAPLYLMSFVCRPGSRPQQKVDTKFDVPMGLTEEYLFRYHFGGPSSDIIDTLQEYWHDWGAFGRNLYKFQDLFPWDCTEAYGRYPSMCGECDIAKHILAFPFDSWSISALHLARSPFFYARTNPASAETFSNPEWIQNRLLVLSAQEMLIRVASAMAQNSSFAAATDWLHKQDDPSQDRLKLGGIHRAQPFSHGFEPRSIATFLTAPWTLLQFSDQKATYEVLRNYRMKLPDVELSFVTDDLSTTDNLSLSSDGSIYLTGPGRNSHGFSKSKITAPYGNPPRQPQIASISFATGFGWKGLTSNGGFIEFAPVDPETGGGSGNDNGGSGQRGYNGGYSGGSNVGSGGGIGSTSGGGSSFEMA